MAEPISTGVLLGGAAITAGSSLLGGYMNNQANARSVGQANQMSLEAAHRTNIFNRNEAKKQRAWTERMSNTAWQRGMADMKKAGLNPMLAFSQGGASSGSGASASGSTPNAQAAHSEEYIGKSVGAGISTAMEGRRLKKEIELVGSQVAANAAGEFAAREQAKLNQANAKQSAAMTKKLETSQYREALEAKTLQTMMPAIQKEAKVREKHAEMDEKAATLDAFLKRIGQGMGIINNATGAARRMTPRGGKRGETIIDGNTGEILQER